MSDLQVTKKSLSTPQWSTQSQPTSDSFIHHPETHSILYRLNVSELKPSLASDYAFREQAKLSQAEHRIRLETSFLKTIMKSGRKMTRFPKSIENKESIFHFLNDYINSSIDNSYVNWFERNGTIEDCRSFVKEYGADQVYFTQYLSQLATIAPEKAAVEIYSNLFDETGIDLFNKKQYCFSSFHPEIFRKLNKYFQVPSAERYHLQADLNPETYYCINMMLLSIRLGYLQGAGAMFLLESSIPYQLSKINKGMIRLGVSSSERQFLEMHCELDEIHAQNWWTNGICDFLFTEQDLAELLVGIDLAISARNQLWNGLLRSRTL